MRVVVGRTYRQTPVFSARMTYLEFNPYWNVPRRLAAQDILPKAREDPMYLVSRKIRVLSDWSQDSMELDPLHIDWSLFDGKNFSYRFRQDPGPLNALGRIKFMFPNEHNVYLHDTPDRELFGRTVRTFSSGCIRIEKAFELAAYLLGDDPRWTGDAIRAAIDSGRTQAVRLKEPIPVHLMYATVWRDKGGTVHFRDDIYGRDQRLARALGLGNAP